MKRTLGRDIEIREMEEKVSEAGRCVVVIELDELADRDEILEKGREIKRKWEVGVDENLMLEERKMRWRILEAVRRKTARGRRVEFSNREI